ncbi:MAG: hypothetical protein V4525_06075 [Pseudomonadota bacterium]
MATVKKADGLWNTPAIAAIPAPSQDTRIQTINYKAAIDNSGNVMLIFHISYMNSLRSLQYTRMLAQSNWLEPEELSKVGVQPTIVMNSSGAGMMAWNDGSFIIAAWFDKNGWQGRKRFSDNIAMVDNPFLIMDEKGNAAVFWEQYLGYKKIWGSIYKPTKGWSTSEIISNEDLQASLKSVSGLSHGCSAALWMQGEDIVGNFGIKAWILPFTFE